MHVPNLPSTTTAGGPRALADKQRAMMRRFPTGVAVVTAFAQDGAPRGMTVSSLCSLSLDPPILLVCLRAASPTLEAVTGSGRFAVNLLHGDAAPVAELFASGDPDRFERAGWRAEAEDPDAAGPHLGSWSHAIADCRTAQCHPAGDHRVVFGEILDIDDSEGPAPLLYGLRSYAQWPRDSEVALLR
jgi:flavin reductase (NADH)